MPLANLAMNVGGRGNDQKQIYVLRKIDMSNRVGIFRRVIVNQNVIFGQSAKRQRLDKFGRVSRHRHANLATRFLQQAQNLNRFIGGNSAATPKPTRYFFFSGHKNLFKHYHS